MENKFNLNAKNYFRVSNSTSITESILVTSRYMYENQFVSLNLSVIAVSTKGEYQDSSFFWGGGNMVNFTDIKLH